MDQDPPGSHTGRSPPESAALAPGLRIASGQSSSWSTGTSIDPRSVPRYTPSVSLPRDLGTLETSTVPRSLTPQDYLVPYSAFPRSESHYTLFPRDDRPHSHVGDGQASNYQARSCKTYHVGSPKTGSITVSSPAGGHPSPCGRRQSLPRGQQDSRQPGQSDLSHPRQLGPDTSSSLEEDHVVLVPSPGVISPTPAPTSMPIHSRRSRDAPASLDSSSPGTQEQRFTGAHSNDLSFIPEFSTDPGQNSPGRLTAVGDILRSMPVSTSGLEQGSCRHPTVVEHNASDLVGLGHPIAINTQLSAVSQSQIEDVVSSDAGLDVSEDEDFRPAQQSTGHALTHGDSRSCDLSSSHNLSKVDTRKDSSVPDSPGTRPGSHMRLISTSTTSTDGTDGTDSDYLPSENEFEPLSAAINSLTIQLITCLLAGWLWNFIALDFNNLVESLRKCPQGSATGQAGKSAGKRRLTESPCERNNNSMYRDGGDESDHEGDGQSRRRRRKIQKVDDSSPSSPRLLACPFHKRDPLRFSVLNEREKEYRRCSSGYWPDINRLKQHLIRVHRRPRFYCPSCYVTFPKQTSLDGHLRQRPACDASPEPKFEEKMNDEQMTEINKKRPGMSNHELWNLIFTVLFPGAPVPDSPYIATSERELVRNLREHFCQEAPRILSSLLQGRLQPALPSGPMDPDWLERICERSTQECVTLVIQLLASGRGTPSRQPNADAPLDRHLDEAGSSNSHSMVQLESALAAPQHEINHTLPGQDRPTSHGYPCLCNLSGSIEPTFGYPDIIPNFSGHHTSFPEQHNTVVPGSMLDLDFDQLSNFVGQNTSSWGHLPIMDRAGPDHVYS